MALYEHDINTILARILAARAKNWFVTPQSTGEIRDYPTKAVDVLINQKGRQPVVIENKYEPDNADQNAIDRLGLILDASGEPIRAVISLQTPDSLKHTDSLLLAERKLNQISVRYCLYHGHSCATAERYPTHGYIDGDIVDLAAFIDAAAFPVEALAKSIEVLENGVKESISVLRELSHQTPDFKSELAEMFTQSFRDEKVDQVLGIGVTILINALVFQQRLAGLHGIRSISRMQSSNALNQSGILKEWERILDINYWSVFSLATSFLKIVHVPRYAHLLVQRITHTAERLTELGVAESHDIAGVVFQRFITDRKYLATFYTRPESATLLAQLAIQRCDVADISSYRSYRIADYACGTGTLIQATYHRLAKLHEFCGGSPEQEHGYKMAETLTAFDVVPSAAHLTASMLSGVFPRQTYEKTRVTIPAYGAIIGANNVFLGSLELLAPENRLFSTFDITESTAIHARTEEREPYALNVEAGTEDLVIMNPPFTRAMSDWIQGDEGTYKPFNALGNTPNIQARMKAREKKLTKKTCYNGYHSMPSAFCAIAHKMVREGGRIALVLPLTCCVGVSWQKFRNLLATHYRDVIVVSIAARREGDTSWSANTSISEVLISAVRRNLCQKLTENSKFGLMVNLFRRPESSMHALEVGRVIMKLRATTTPVRTLDSGVVGVHPIAIGNDSLGEAIFGNLERQHWPSVGIRKLALGQIIEELAKGKLTTLELSTFRLDIASLKSFARVGPADNNIANNQAAAFDRYPSENPKVYPMLWRCESNCQESLIANADTEGAIRPGRERKATSIWDTRSHVHIAREVGFQSHRVISLFTRQRCIGGRSWPSLQLPEPRQEKALCMWLNTTLGLMLYWYFSAKQQRTRGIMTVSALATFPVIDVTHMSEQQLQDSDALFERIANSKFDRISNSYSDPVRASLDDAFLGEILGLSQEFLDELNELRELWCQEPSIMINR